MYPQKITMLQRLRNSASEDTQLPCVTWQLFAKLTLLILASISPSSLIMNFSSAILKWSCRVPEKIQLLQIPETCDGASKEGEMAKLQETYVLSPRKLKKASGVSCRALVSEIPGYCGVYSPWNFQQTPIIEKSVSLTPEICNKAWREGIVTLLDLTTRSVRVGNSILYDYVPQNHQSRFACDVMPRYSG